MVYTTTTANTGTGLTVNINSLGAKSVAIASSSGWTTTLTAGSIPANKPMRLCYDGTNWDASGTGYQASGGGITVQFGTANPNGVNTPTLVQSANSASSSNTLTVTTSSAVTGGNLLVVVVCTGSSNSLTASDTLGTTYTLIKSMPNYGGTELYLWAGIAPAGGSNTVSVSGLTSSPYSDIGVAEFTVSTTTLDGVVQSTTSGGSPTTTLTTTTSVINDLLIAVVGSQSGGGTVTMTSGWTKIFSSTSYYQLSLGYQIASSTGSYSNQWTLTSGGNNNSILAALKATSTPVSGATGDLYFQTSALPYTGFVYNSGQWNQIQ